jgi:putative membrane protein
MIKNKESIKSANTLKYVWLIVFFFFLLWSGINPKDTLTWLLEVSPALFAVLILLYTYNSFKLTTLAYILILAHSIVLMIGGHYTYADVPFFDYLKEIFNLSRNNYDKLGHFMQGFVPAIIAREIIIRKNIISGTGYQSFFIVTFTLAVSAFYELIEWWVALLIGEDADSFLGTQGYIWDTQSDMALALFGSVISLIVLSKTHDKQLAKIHS